MYTQKSYLVISLVLCAIFYQSTAEIIKLDHEEFTLGSNLEHGPTVYDQHVDIIGDD